MCDYVDFIRFHDPLNLWESSRNLQQPHEQLIKKIIFPASIAINKNFRAKKDIKITEFLDLESVPLFEFRQQKAPFSSSIAETEVLLLRNQWRQKQLGEGRP